MFHTLFPRPYLWRHVQADTGDAGVIPGRESRPKTPRWVKVFGIIGAGVLLLVLIFLVTGQGGPGGHGPGRHMPSGDDTPSGNQTTSGTHTSPFTHGPKRHGDEGPAAENRMRAATTHP